LGKLTGRVDVEEILDVIFREFCLGKWRATLFCGTTVDYILLDSLG
jgi:hypothetical protein